MLAKVALDSGSLNLVHPGDAAEQEAAHRSILVLLQAHGLVIFGTERDKEQFISAVKHLPGSVRKLWTVGLEGLTSRISSHPIEKSLKEVIDDGDELATTWGGAISVAFAEKERAAPIGLPRNVVAAYDASGIEVVRMEQALASEEIRRLQTLGRTPLQRGDDRDAIWRLRFKPLTTHAGRVTIVDRYAMSAHTRALGSGQGSGLSWIINRLGDDGVPHVHLIVQRSKQQQAFHQLLALRSQLTAAPASLSVTFVSSRTFMEKSHARHLRCDDWVVSLDKGCEIFAQQLLKQEAPTQFGAAKSVLKREEALESSAKADERRVRVWP